MYELVPGTFARVGPGVARRITTGDQPVQLLAIGGTPGGLRRAGVHGERRGAPRLSRACRGGAPAGGRPRRPPAPVDRVARGKRR